MRSIKKIVAGIKQPRGFTLVEMSIVVMLIGIAVATFAPLYKLHLERKAISTTAKNIETVNAAVSAFRGINGRYPCPASLVATPEDPNYGHEDCSNYTTSIPPGNCDIGEGGSGICREESEREITYLNPYVTGTPSVTGNPPVRVGTLPFRDLNVDEKKVYDGYNNRIVYAITEHLMFDSTFRGNEGGINIVNNNSPPTSVISPEASAHFVIFSNGKNSNGAFTKDGTRIPCPESTAETFNCDITASARYTLVQENNAGGMGQFDDVMTYFTQSDIPLWQFSAQQRGDIVQKPGGDVAMNFAQISGNFTGRAAQEDFKGLTKEAQVAGVLRAVDSEKTDDVIEGNIMANDYCDPNTGNCFQTSVLAGEITPDDGIRTGGLRCPDDDPDGVGRFMVGITDNRAICEDDIPIGCPTGQIMSGIDTNGRVICSANIQCQEQDIQLCPTLGRTYTLPRSAPGRVITVDRSSGGAGKDPRNLTRVQTFTCNNSGAWTNNAATGACTCTARADETRTNVACGRGFRNTFTQTRSYICPTHDSANGTAAAWGAWQPPAYNGTATSWTYPDSSPCECVGDTATQNVTCPIVNQIPSHAVQTRNFTCSGPRSGSWGAWSPPNNQIVCLCPAQADRTREESCGPYYPAGQKKIITERFNRSTCTWSVHSTDSSACKCEAAWTTPRTLNCPDGYSGSIKVLDYYECPRGLIKTEPVENTCAPPPPRRCSWTSETDALPSDTRQGKVRKGASCETCGAKETACYTGSLEQGYHIYYACVCD